MPREQRVREWCFTKHDWTDADIEHLGTKWREYATYLCFQPELAPGTGRRHLQGYFCLTTPRTLRGVKNTLFDTASLSSVHLEAAKGTKEEARDYCRKEDSFDDTAGFGFTDFGDFEAVPSRRGQGARNDIANCTSILRSGGSLAEVAEADPDSFVKYHKGFIAYQQLICCQPRVRDEGGLFPALRVFWFYGPTGSGKTRAAFEEAGDQAIYTKPAGNKWWDGYTGQPVILLDDFRSDWFTFGYLLRLLDIYPMPLEYKGGMTNLCSQTIYITCPNHPEVLYEDLMARKEGASAQLLRRISEIRQFGEPPAAVVEGIESFN